MKNTSAQAEHSNGKAPWDGLPIGLPMYRQSDLRAKIGLSTTSIYEMMAAGTFPRPVKLGPRIVAWPKSHIDAWLADRAEQSQRTPARERRRTVV
jgi:prophage regulatory protein